MLGLLRALAALAESKEHKPQRTVLIMHNDFSDHRKYLGALREFRARLPEFERLASVLASEEDWQVRGKTVYDSDFHKLLYRLHDRRRGAPFDDNELACWRDGVCLCWKMVPSDVLGLFRTLNWLSEESETADVLALLEDTKTLRTIKATAQNTDRRFGKEGFGQLIAGHAKTILARHSRKSSFSQATASGMDRMLAFFCARANLRNVPRFRPP